MYVLHATPIQFSPKAKDSQFAKTEKLVQSTPDFS